MSTVYQWVFDNAESITVNNRGVVAQTITRDQRIRTMSRGGETWKFTVSLPTGPRWQDIRYYIAGIDSVDRTAIEYINFSKSSYRWMFEYRGDATSTAGLTLRYTASQAAINTKVLQASNLPTMSSSAALFQAGDLVQMTGSPYVYQVTDRVNRGSDTTVNIPVHRSVLDTPSDTYATAKIGHNVEFRVICIQRPDWSWVERNIVGWSGEFVFHESL